MLNFGGESEKILKKALETRGFIGGDDKGYVEMSQSFLDAVMDWKDYMENLYGFYVEELTPKDLREKIQKEIEDLRADITNIEKQLAEKTITPEDANRRYSLIIQDISTKQDMVQVIENYLMTTPYKPWREEK